MFDEPPKNLPVEPMSPTPNPPMQGGIIQSKKGEPEDILSEIEAPRDEAVSVAPEMPDARPGGGKFKVLIIILSALAIVLILTIAGIFFYQRFIAVEPAMDDAALMEEEPGEPLAPTMPTIPALGAGAVNVEEEEESPPVVPETPQPDIPEPEPVNSTRDTDNDGLSDSAELNLGTDPLVADTDGDGLTDGDEIALGTDPLVADTDGDGLTDGDEVNVWLTNPLNPDTDGDGYSDGDEVKNGYNPNGEGRLPNVE